MDPLKLTNRRYPTAENSAYKLKNSLRSAIMEI